MRTATATYKRTATKNRFRELRRQLAEGDQTILVLRLDRDFAWEEIARITLSLGREPSPEELRSESARLRKRFERAREELRELAEAEGLLEVAE